MRIYKYNEIEKALDIRTLMSLIEKGLILHSENKVLSPPNSFLHFPLGDIHIKSAAIQGEDLAVIKIASGFPHNSKSGYRTSNGLMVLFSQKTGEPLALILDEGRLTDLRTALVGAICAKALAPANVQSIGIIGTGIQAKEQLKYLNYATSCRDVWVWGRTREKAIAFSQEPELADYRIAVAQNIEQITDHCNLIVTTTGSTQPLLYGSQLKPGTHVTAVGADQKGKQELDVTVFQKADLIIADSLDQCWEYGDLSCAKGLNLSCSIKELGHFLKDPLYRRPEWITIADLTGLAVEDLAVAKMAYSQ